MTGRTSRGLPDTGCSKQSCDERGVPMSFKVTSGVSLGKSPAVGPLGHKAVLLSIIRGTSRLFPQGKANGPDPRGWSCWRTNPPKRSRKARPEGKGRCGVIQYFQRERERERDRVYVTSSALCCYNCPILLFVIVNFLLGLIHALIFILGLYEKKLVFTTFGTIYGFRHPLGVFKCAPHL